MGSVSVIITALLAITCALSSTGSTRASDIHHSNSTGSNAVSQEGRVQHAVVQAGSKYARRNNLTDAEERSNPFSWLLSKIETIIPMSWKTAYWLRRRKSVEYVQAKLGLKDLPWTDVVDNKHYPILERYSADLAKRVKVDKTETEPVKGNFVNAFPKYWEDDHNKAQNGMKDVRESKLLDNSKLAPVQEIFRDPATNRMLENALNGHKSTLQMWNDLSLSPKNVAVDKMTIDELVPVLKEVQKQDDFQVYQHYVQMHDFNRPRPLISTFDEDSTKLEKMARVQVWVKMHWDYETAKHELRIVRKDDTTQKNHDLFKYLLRLTAERDEHYGRKKIGFVFE